MVLLRLRRLTAEDAVKDVGALPLLSYTLDDMWSRMVKAEDGVLLTREDLAARLRTFLAERFKLVTHRETQERKGYALVGDVHPIDVTHIASAYTPVPGGVGPLTIAMLMANTVGLAEKRLISRE